MFSLKRGFVTVAASVVMSTPMYAQQQLTIEDAIQHALTYKAEAVKAKLDVENSKYKIQEVRGNALPQINGSFGITHNPIIQQMALNMNGQTMVVKMGQPWTSTPAVQLDQQLFNLAVFTGLQAAKSTSEFYVINEQLTEEQIVEKVASSYYDVYKTKSQLKTLERTLANTTRVRDVLLSLYNNGLAKKIDLDRMNVALNNVNSSRQQLVNALALQENALKYLIGMDISKPIELPEGAFDIDANKYLEQPNFESTNRAEIRLLDKQTELLQYNKKAINAQRYPSLALSANYGHYGLGDKFPYFAGKDNGVNWSDFASISLNLRVPIFAGLSNRAKVKQAQIEIEKHQLDVNDTKLALQLDAQNAYTQIKNAIITLNQQEANQMLAKEVLDNVENNYKNGLANLTDLLDAENSYADAQNSYTNAMVEFKLAEVKLAKAKGELLNAYAK
jgi:outer membrane protein